MADFINFTLPQFSNDTSENDLKQIKSYLYTLTEQMKFYLNNIDADNYNDAYREKMAALIDSNTTNSIKANVVQESMRKMKKEYNAAISDAVKKISGNLGGYIVTLDLNDDGMPDDLRILVDTSDYTTATKYWQFNKEGLAYIIKEGDSLTSNLALTADGYIAAERIKGIIGSFVTLEACTLNACTGSFSGTITAGAGTIANWTIVEDKLFSRITVGQTTYETVIKNDKDKFDNDKKTFYVNKFTGGYNSDTIPVNLEDEYKEELFYIRRNGEAFVKYGQIGKWKIDPEMLTESGGLYSDHGNWRIYLQSAYESETVSRNDFYAISTQYKGTDGYYVTGGIKMDGRFWTDKGYYISGSGQGVFRESGTNSYGLITYTSKGNVVVGDFTSSGDVNIYSASRIFLCLENYDNRIYIDDETWKVGDNTIGVFHTLTSNRGIWFNVNSGNSEFSIKALRFRIDMKNITTAGNLYMNSDGLIVTSSSAAKLKENITDQIDSELNPMKLLDATVKQFNYKSEYKDNVIFAGKQIGFIADELEKVYPVACLYNSQGEADNWNDRIVISALFYIVQNIYKELKEMQKNET